MKRIIDTFSSEKKAFSFELFPPKTDKGYENLLKTIGELSTLKPDYISCTYGAGGGHRGKTFDIVQHIQDKHKIPAMAHFTCVLNTRDDIKSILEDAKSRGICNILALRGDPPKDNPDWQPGEENLKYSSELCAFIRQEFGDHFGIAVAGFPEGHLLCPDRDQDALYLKEKVKSGADFVITQLFFDNRDYFQYVNRLKNIDVNINILPGILPITDYEALVRFAGMCGATVTDEVTEIFKPLVGDAEATQKAGIDFAIKQCRALLEAGAPGIHFYCLNKLNPSAAVLEAIR